MAAMAVGITLELPLGRSVAVDSAAAQVGASTVVAVSTVVEAAASMVEAAVVSTVVVDSTAVAAIGKVRPRLQFYEPGCFGIRAFYLASETRRSAMV